MSREDASTRAWPGLVPAVRRFFFGAASPPKAKRYSETSTPTTSRYYEGMNEGYRWFRQDELVRRCILTGAFFATMTAGFETALEARGDADTDDYAHVKDRIDGFNKSVNLDLALFVAQVKRSVHGKAGFEVVLDVDGYPSWLLPLQSDKLKPRLDEDWSLTGFSYGGRQGFYRPEEVLYFVNFPLEADREGISDVEPVADVCRARHHLLREDFPEIARTIWAPYVILKADTSGLGKEEADRVVEDLAEVARAGKSISVNESVEAVVVDTTPDISGLCELLDKLEQSIIGNFGTPRFLLGKPTENRATAYAELEAYVDGPIRHIQKYLAREVERQWYDRWTRKILEDEGHSPADDGALPVALKHRWRKIRSADLIEWAKAVAVLWGRGDGPIGGRREKVWDLMGWPEEEASGVRDTP